jgi:hypothetical protein
VSIKNQLLKILFPKSNLGYIKIGEEDRLCIEFANYLRQLTLETDFPYIWFHIPNQIGLYKPIFGIKQGWMGRIPGVSDFCFVGRNKSFFIEFKSQKGKQSENQKIFEKWCKKNDIEVYVCRSMEEAKNVIKKI